MTLFQFLMLAMTAYFSFQVFMHIQKLEDQEEKTEGEGFLNMDAKTLEQRADEFFISGDLEKAFLLLDHANIKEPHNAEILGKMGFILTKLGRDNEAISYYQEALNIDNDNEMLHNALASLYRKSGVYDKAQNHYEESLKINSSYDITYYNYGNLLADMQRKSEAYEMYKKALQLNPEFTEAKEEIAKLEDNK